MADDLVTEEISLEGSPDEVHSESATRSTPRSRSGANYDMSRYSWFSILLNLCCLILFGYAILYQNFDKDSIMMKQVFEPRIQIFGLWKFLTYHSLLIQTASCFLHLVAHVATKYRILQDIVFTAFAFPIGNLVVISFWLVYWTQGRDMIYPKAIEKYFPVWLNHVTHTIILPLNLTQTYLTYHRYLRKGSILSLCYMLGYYIFTLYIRYRAGVFVYPFMNQMSTISVTIYLTCILFCTVILYEISFLLTGIFHARKIRRYRE